MDFYVSFDTLMLIVGFTTAIVVNTILDYFLNSKRSTRVKDELIKTFDDQLYTNRLVRKTNDFVMETNKSVAERLVIMQDTIKLVVEPNCFIAKQVSDTLAALKDVAPILQSLRKERDDLKKERDNLHKALSMTVVVNEAKKINSNSKIKREK